MNKRARCAVWGLIALGFAALSALVITWTAYGGLGTARIITFWRLPTYATIVLASVAVAGGTYLLQHFTANRAVDLGLVGVSALDLVIFTLSLVLVPLGQFAQFNAYVMPWVYLAVNALLCFCLGLLALRRSLSATRLIVAAALLTMVLAALSAFLARLLPTYQLGHLIANKAQGVISTNGVIFNTPATWIATALILGALVGVLAWWRPLSVVSGRAVRATTLGVNVRLARGGLLLAASMFATGAFLLVGHLVFIGFVACHLARYFWRAPSRGQFCLALGFAANLILLVHFINSNWLAWNLPLGVISALAAAPYLLLVWLRRAPGGFAHAH